jgi:DNA-directed RNA polymerase specialized sigma24 family protein
MTSQDHPSDRPTTPYARETQRTAPSPRGTAGAALRKDRGADRVEAEVRAILSTGDEAGAAAAALRSHGDEVFGFLLGVLDSGADAGAVYAGVGARVRRELGRFGWRCSLRTWMYAVSRREVERHARRSQETTVVNSLAPVILSDETTTLPARYMGLAAAIAALRSRLAPDDRALLILRLDRGLDLGELAVTELGETASPGDLRREAERIRGQLRRIRDDLARLAVEHQILAPLGERHG